MLLPQLELRTWLKARNQWPVRLITHGGEETLNGEDAW
jgi:hypothetical protein